MFKVHGVHLPPTYSRRRSPASREQPPATPRPAERDRLERWAEWALGGPLAAAVVGLCVLMLAAWFPSYLKWPLWNDASEFATMAQGWSTGKQLPYRDIINFNLPGQIYMFRLVGWLAGWGQTWAFYALDASLLVGFGVLLIAWVHLRTGRMLPGAVALLAILAFYFDLAYHLVAQRDWQAALFVATSIMVLQMRPGRLVQVLSAACLAFALSLRPQTVLFWPAVALAIDEAVRRTGESWRKTAVGLVQYGLAGAFFLGLLVLPLVLDGIFDDMIRGVQLAMPGGDYGKASVRLPLTTVLYEDFVMNPRRLAVPVLILLLVWGRPNTPWRRTALTWMVALAAIAFYRPISPTNPHDYLRQPLVLVSAVSLALLVEKALQLAGASATAKVITVVLVVMIGVDHPPSFCNLSDFRMALSPRRTERASSGYLRAPSLAAMTYRWKDYFAVLNYLRKLKDPETRVANALFYDPALTAPSGRLTAFPTTALSLPQIVPEYAPLYVNRLINTPNSVVVWSPHEPYTTDQPNLRHEVLNQLRPVIRKYYKRAARFGGIEVWRRKPGAAGAPPAEAGRLALSGPSRPPKASSARPEKQDPDRFLGPAAP